MCLLNSIIEIVKACLFVNFYMLTKKYNVLVLAGVFLIHHCSFEFQNSKRDQLIITNSMVSPHVVLSSTNPHEVTSYANL